MQSTREDKVKFLYDGFGGIYVRAESVDTPAGKSLSLYIVQPPYVLDGVYYQGIQVFLGDINTKELYKFLKEVME